MAAAVCYFGALYKLMGNVNNNNNNNVSRAGCAALIAATMPGVFYARYYTLLPLHPIHPIHKSFNITSERRPATFPLKSVLEQATDRLYVESYRRAGSRVVCDVGTFDMPWQLSCRRFLPPTPSNHQPSPLSTIAGTWRREERRRDGRKGIRRGED